MSDTAQLFERKPGGTDARRIAACLRAVWLPALVLTATAWGQPAAEPLPPDPAYPSGISPSHVFVKIDLLERSLDALIAKRNLPTTRPPQEIESEIKPMHVYQFVMNCMSRLQRLDDRLGAPPVPYVAAQPRKYNPRDVHLLASLMLENVRAIAELESVLLPMDERPELGKTPTDVFNRSVKVFMKLNALCEFQDVRPDEVFAQMVRVEADVKSILQQADPACRYSIVAPQVPSDARPADAFAQCLEVRREINKIRASLGMREQPVPAMPEVEIRPSDVFLQTQIIIAELNLIKMQLKTVSSTPLTIPVTGKTPTDVHQKAKLVQFLLQQIQT